MHLFCKAVLEEHGRQLRHSAKYPVFTRCEANISSLETVQCRILALTTVRTRVQTPRACGKLDTVAQTCGPAASPVARWEAETGKFLKAHRAASWYA